MITAGAGSLSILAAVQRSSSIFVARAAPSQQPEITIDIQAILAQVSGSHLRCRIRPMEITCSGTGRLKAKAPALRNPDDGE